jgi:hypothetical protein
MNRSPLIEGQFTVCTILSMPNPRKKIFGRVSFTDKDDKPATASFMFEDGWRIIPEGANPIFASGGYGRVGPGCKLVALIAQHGTVGNVLTDWGTVSQYGEARAEIDGRTTPKAQVSVLPDKVRVRMRRTLRISPELQAVRLSQLQPV